MTDLKPDACPFCGYDGISYGSAPNPHGGYQQWCECGACEARGPVSDGLADQESDVDLWNRRSPEGEAGARLIQSAQEAVSLAPIAADRDAYRALLERAVEQLERSHIYVVNHGASSIAVASDNRTLAFDIRKKLEGGGNGE